MMATLLPTDVFYLFDGSYIHVNAIEKSVQVYDSSVVLRARMAFLYSLANNVAAQSSNLGIVSCFSVAILDVEQRSSQDILLLLSVERSYR
jgi:hypothetical protein